MKSARQLSNGREMSFLEKKKKTLNMQTARYKYIVPESILSNYKKSSNPNLE